MSPVELPVGACLVLTIFLQTKYFFRSFDPFLSDHQMREFRFEKSHIDSPETILKYSINVSHMEQFENRLKQIKWKHVIAKSAEESYDRFHQIFQTFFDETFPKIKVKAYPSKRYAIENSDICESLRNAVQTIHRGQRSKASRDLLNILNQSDMED
ncbi:hypothetical protein HHI36_021005 [Cryptolaemus montrouzieri]|uniref:Uncharacterized protein n=1 Tax=Cryptolaemus montrouzieri TaxID=559131 RepID=A0ABD2MVI2_9CUCU